MTDEIPRGPSSSLRDFGAEWAGRGVRRVLFHARQRQGGGPGRVSNLLRVSENRIARSLFQFFRFVRLKKAKMPE